MARHAKQKFGLGGTVKKKLIVKLTNIQNTFTSVSEKGKVEKARLTLFGQHITSKMGVGGNRKVPWKLDITQKVKRKVEMRVMSWWMVKTVKGWNKT